MRGSVDISIIIPAYNAEPYLEKCLDSILGTKGIDFEIIAVDDGSADGTVKILRDYADRYPNIRVLEQQNAGASAARNAGLALAEGDYVGFVDADDWVENTMFSEMVSAARREQADIVFCNICRNESEKMIKYLRNGSFDEQEIVSEIYPRLISNLDETNGKTVLRGSVWCRIFDRQLLTEHGIRFDRDLVYNEDGLFEIEATLYAKRYCYLGDSYLYHNRFVEGSVTKRYIPDLWKRQQKIYEKLQRIVSGAAHDFSGQIRKKLFEVAVYCIENLYKPTCPLSASERKKQVLEIMTNPVLRECLASLNPHSFKKINRAYYAAMRLKSPFLAGQIAAYRAKKHRTR